MLFTLLFAKLVSLHSNGFKVMKNLKLFIILAIALSFNAITSLSFAQSGYKIIFDLQGLNDSILLLANYSGDKQFVVDTAYPEKNNRYIFSGDKDLLTGMYFIAGQNKSKIFDFLISDSRNFTISGNKDHLPQSLKVNNSKENHLFFNYILFLNDKQKERAQYLEIQKKNTPGSDSALGAANQINLVNEEVQRYINGIINSNSGSLISAFLKAMQEPEIPSSPILSNGRPDSTFPYRYFKNHFWDNIDLSDDRLVRTPFLHGKVEQYLTKLTHPAPDSLIKSIDELFIRSGNNPETFKYLMWYLTIKYESSEIMGYDAIFVHLVDKYYTDEKMGWMNPTVKENLIKKANKLKNVLIGQVAPEMILLDTLQQPVSLHKIKAEYTIIYFWDPDCSHCKKETPLLKDLYSKSKPDLSLEVYAVCMDTSWVEMKKYIRKNNTSWINVNGFYSLTPDFRELYDVNTSPVMFLLDKKKNIIAKRILTSQMEAFINQHRQKTLSEN
jgi:thiol-disulfide isomerase/thioredoxin